ncbi:hypothetical protein SAMN02745830_07080 [Streptomyces sp. Amel2xC10]|nr:hypothetical protein SAMN02745830_07080 [Streptomyces sp. Amel2xC10]
MRLSYGAAQGAYAGRTDQEHNQVPVEPTLLTIVPV